jgi:hypothetical protein
MSELEAKRSPDVRRAGVTAAERADVDARKHARDPVAPGHAPEEIAGSDEEDRAHSVIVGLAQDY